MTKNWGKGKVGLTAPAGCKVRELRPTELHLKEDGAIGDRPSITIVLTPHPSEHEKIFGQISVDMLNEAFNELGYMLTPLPAKTLSEPPEENDPSSYIYGE